MARAIVAGGISFVVLVFALGYASAYLPPSAFWWTGVLASVLPYATFLALLAAVVAVLLLGRRWLWVLVAVVLLATLRFLPLSRLFHDRPAQADGDLVVMTFNAPVRGPNPDTLANVTVRLVEQIGPDILALQEPAIWIAEQGRRKATAHIQAVIDTLRYWAPSPQGAGSRHTIMQPVLARFPMGDAERFQFGSFPGSKRATTIMRVPFMWKGRRAVLYNVHLYTTGAQKPWLLGMDLFNLDVWRDYFRQYRDSYLRRAWEARLLRELIEKEKIPVIVAGDFNSTVHGWEVRYTKTGLQDAFQTGGNGWGATYHARFPIFRIDHILVSPEWEVVEAHVPSTPTLSDHRPLVARLRWKDASEPDP